MEVTFSNLVSKSWTSFKLQWQMAVGLTLLVIVVSAIGGKITGLGWIITSPLNIGWIRAMAKLSEGQRAEFEDLLWPYRSLERFIHSLLISVIYALGVLLGIVLLVVPGLWFAVAGSLGTYYLAMSEPNCVNAVKRSMAAVKGNWWHMFGIFLGCIGILLLGLIFFGVGILVAAPLIGIIMVNLAKAWDRGPIAQAPVTSHN